MSTHAAKLLAERAKALAAKVDTGAEDVTAEAIVVAALGRDRIGVPLMAAREVVAFTGAAAVPGAPAWLKGVTQLRGEMLSVLDLLAWWKPGQSCAGKHLVVVDGTSGPIAILADEVVEVREVSSRDMADRLKDDLRQARPGVAAVTRDLVFVLDIEQMLRHPALLIHQGDTTVAAEAGVP